MSIHHEKENWPSLIALSVLLIWTAVSIVQHGTLFDAEYLLAGGVLCAISTLLAFWGRIALHPAAYFLAGLTLLYAAAASYAINTESSWLSTLRLASALPLLFLAARLTRSHVRVLIIGFVWSCSAITVIATISKLFRDGRLEGTLQYANAWGMLLLTALFMSITLYIQQHKGIYLWPVCILTSGVLLSGSRAVTLIMIAGLLLQFLAVGKQRWKLVRLPASAGLAGVCLTFLYPWSVWPFLTALVVAPAVLIMMKKLPYSVAIARIWLALMGVLIIGVIAFIPSEIWRRLLTASPTASEWVARLGYYHDAWKIISTSPILGYGGGAWPILQYRYQTAAYTVRYLHNYWLETWIETGAIGLALYGAVVFCLIWRGFKAYRMAAGEERLWRAGCLIASVCLIAHSTVDFTFSYPLLFGVCLFLGAAAGEQNITNTAPLKKAASARYTMAIRIAVACSFALIAFICIRQSLSQSLLQQANQEVRAASRSLSQDAPRIASLLERSSALSLAPASQHEQLAALYAQLFIEAKQPPWIEKAASEAAQAQKLNPQDAHLLLLAAQIQYLRGDAAGAQDAALSLRKQFPFRSDIADQLRQWQKAER